MAPENESTNRTAMRDFWAALVFRDWSAVWQSVGMMPGVMRNLVSLVTMLCFSKSPNKCFPISWLCILCPLPSVTQCPSSPKHSPKRDSDQWWQQFASDTFTVNTECIHCEASRIKYSEAACFIKVKNRTCKQVVSKHERDNSGE